MAVFVFLFYLAAGLVVSLAWVPIGEEGRRFFLFNAALGFALGGTGLCLRVAGPASWSWGEAVRPDELTVVLAVAGLTVLAGYLLHGTIRHELRWPLRVSAVLLGLAVVSDGYSLHRGQLASSLPGGVLLHVANAVTSAWLAGSILLAMVLGHFYLVLPRMSVAPLRSVFRFSLLGLIARILVVAMVGILWWSHGGASAWTVSSFLNRGVFVLQRLLFGLFIPATLAYFTYKTIEMRSTQSATGILYVVVFLTLVGEALSVYLSLDTTVPL